MKPYTPRTEGVRDTYVRAQRTDVARSEFDRWLESVRAEAWDEGYELGICGTNIDNPYGQESK